MLSIHCTTFGAYRALSLWTFVFFVAKVSHPPKLQHSQKRKQPNDPQSGAAKCRIPGKNADFRTVFCRTAMVSDTTSFAWCQAPVANCRPRLGVRHPGLLWCQAPVEQLMPGSSNDVKPSLRFLRASSLWAVICASLAHDSISAQSAHVSIRLPLAHCRIGHIVSQ